VEKYKHINLTVASSPHVVGEINTTKIMAIVIIGLIPSLMVSVFVFGARALFLTLVCVIACVAFEHVFKKAIKQESTVGDLSAVVTGLLLAFNLPVNLPYWQAVIGCFVAIVIVKQLFGGIGQNFANPAVTARVVLLVSFATPMTTWPTAARIFTSADAISGATPLGLFARHELDSLPSNMQMLLGTIGGSMGETSAAALLIGGVFLIYKKIISPAIPVSFLGTMAVYSVLAGVDPMFQIFAGGAIIGAFFMATDYSTSPVTTSGKIIFGIGCGILTMTIRLFGSYPEGVSFAILLMNIVTPHIDALSGKRLYGGGAK
jgi:electron transport complex protein RnfD